MIELFELNKEDAEKRLKLIVEKIFMYELEEKAIPCDLIKKYHIYMKKCLKNSVETNNNKL